MMEKYQIYLFDFDGTLVDSFDSLTRIFQLSYQSIGSDVSPTEVRRLMRIPLIEGYKDKGCDEKKFPLFLEMITHTLKDFEITKLTKNFSDAFKTLKTLKERGAILGIVTSNDIDHVNDVFKHLNIDPTLFSVIVGSNDCQEIKPSPEPVLTALRKLGVTPNNKDIVYIGDSINDYKSGARAGISSILLDRYQEYTDFDCLKISSLIELLN